MPILDVEVVGEITPTLQAGLAQRLADAAGEVFQTEPQRTWIKLRYLDASDYAENASAVAACLPVFVRLLLRTWPAEKERRRIAQELAHACAELCARPVSQVHVLFEAPGEGRIAFGGKPG